MRIEALRGKRIEFRAAFVFALHEPMGNQPPKVLNKPRIVETHPHLQVRLLHRLAVVIKSVEEAGENIQVGTLQTQSQALEKFILRVLVSLLLPLVLSERLEPEVEIYDDPGKHVDGDVVDYEQTNWEG